MTKNEKKSKLKTTIELMRKGQNLHEKRRM